jgi:hypothetical protein
MERATKTVKISDGRIVEIYTYITGRESREIQQIFLEGTKIHFDGIGGTAPSEIDASLAMKAQDKALELLVISLDGEKEKVVDKILDLPKEDYEKVVGAVSEIQNGLSSEKKTK